MTSLPTVSVLVLSHDPGENLHDCVSSLKAQAYPKDRFQIEIVEPGPPGVCAALNAAARRSTSDFVATIDGDVRLEGCWLAELADAATRHHAAAASAKILDWSGKSINNAGGILSFIGHPFRVGFGEPSISFADERPLLFPNLVSALFHRATFLETGGFDEDFFAELEDVDLGWRLNLAGHTVVYAPKALAYRRPDDVSSGWAHVRRLRLVERNALATIYKNYDAESFARIFPVAVALSLLRGLIGSGIDSLSLTVSSRPADIVDVNPRLVAHLIALEDFTRLLPALKRKREVIQRQRRCGDDELFRLFSEPLRLHEVEELYYEAARVLIRDFGIDWLFESHPPTRKQPGAEKADVSRASRRQLTFSSLPTVSIVILTALGATHLPECLASLRQQTYPLDRVEVIVVDNGSAEDPSGEVQRSYPGARTIRNETNIGFAAGNNAGASVATGDYLVFLNDDTRAHPDWLRALVGTTIRRGAAATASCILDWSAERIDFVDGAVNFQGKGFQLDYDAPAKNLTLEEHPLLFACGCAMLIDRAAFIDAGRWDEGTFAYYEDVELGWRLNLLGRSVWFAPRAIVYHKHHGTSGVWPEPPRIRLYERNSLRMLYGLLETKSLERALPAAMVLAADRALLRTALSRASAARPELKRKRFVDSAKAAFRARGITRTTPIGQAAKRLGIRGLLEVARDALIPRTPRRSPQHREEYLIESIRGRERPDWSERVPMGAAAVLAGVYGFLADLPEVTKRRADLQDRRQVPDAEILKRFGSHWLQQVPAPFQAEHDAVQCALVDALAIAAIGSGESRL